MPPARLAAVTRQEFDEMSDTFGSSITTLTVSVNDMKQTVAGLETTVDGMHGIFESGKKLFWRAISLIVGAIVTAAIAVMVQNMAIKSNTATKADLAARTASRYTQEDAQKDRADQEARFEAILAEIRKKK
jgi:hypothetical protein